MRGGPSQPPTRHSSRERAVEAHAPHPPPHAHRPRLPPPPHHLQHFRAPLAPWIELVLREPALPCVDGLGVLPIEPQRAPQLVICLDQIWAERDRLLEERLRILEHVTLEIHETQIEVRIERRLL